jgi:hypothetical protein
MSFTGPLFKFALFQTRLDEFYLFGCCHHIVLGGSGIALVGHRIATVYSAIVSGAPIPPAFFGSLRDLVDCESEYEASNDYLEDHAYWTRNLPPESGPQYRLPQAASERDPYWPSAQVQLDPVVLRRVQELSHVWNVPRSSIITAACALWCVDGALRTQMWCSTSRSPGECVRSQRRFPGWLPGLCRWCRGFRRDLRLPVFVSMLTHEYGKRCSISGFRCMPLSAKPTPAAQGSQPIG